MNFRLTSGTFAYKGHIYNAGDIIESATDLCRVFVNKFTKVDFQAPAAAPAPVQEAPQNDVAAPEAPEAAPEAMEAPQAPPKASPAPSSKAPAGPDKGEDVTDKFPKALEEDFKVFRTAKNEYWIYDNDAPEVRLNSKSLKRADVNKFIQDQITR